MKRFDPGQVPRVTYGAGGHYEMPQGLLLETFLHHAHVHDFKSNRLPKVSETAG